MKQLTLCEWYSKAYRNSKVGQERIKEFGEALEKSGAKFNPEILSDKPTHSYNGIKVKLFTGLVTAEIMEGPDKGKWTTVEIDKLVKL